MLSMKINRQAMLALFRNRWAVEPQQCEMAAEVSRRHEQIDRMSGGKER